MIGDVIYGNLDEKAYSKRLEICKHSLIAMLVLSKGDKPRILSI